MIAYILVWAFFSFWLWPHMIGWTNGFLGNWLTMILVLTWPLIMASLPMTIATGGIKSLLRNIK